MFGVKIPKGDYRIEIRLILGRGQPVLAWNGDPSVPDTQIIDEIAHNQNVSKILHKAVKKGKLRADELDIVIVQAKLYVYQDKEVIFDSPIEMNIALGDDEEFVDQAKIYSDMLIRFDSTVEKINRNASDSIKEIHSTSVDAMAKIADAVGKVAQSTDKLSGLAEKIFTDSSDRTAALLHEVRNSQKAANTQDGIKQIKQLFELLQYLKSFGNEDKGSPV